jgi:hypothetical protein
MGQWYRLIDGIPMVLFVGFVMDMLEFGCAEVGTKK